MGLQIVQIDAFTDIPFAGNPAAVCLLDRAFPDAWLQNVAMEMNLAETAFLLREGENFRLRWFTPTTEVALCGHATLASAHFLWEENHLQRNQMARFHTQSGLLTAAYIADAQLIELDFPAEPATMLDLSDAPPNLIKGIGMPIRQVGRNRMDYLVELESESAVRNLKPDMGLLASLPERGIIVTARAENIHQHGSSASNIDFVSRFFGPAVGVDEDHVTGSAHCCLAPYWAPRLSKANLRGYQASHRGGTVQMILKNDRVLLRGNAVTTLKGELTTAASRT